MANPAETFPVRIASARCNQMVYNFTTNVPYIRGAIDKAVADGADNDNALPSTAAVG